MSFDPYAIRRLSAAFALLEKIKAKDWFLPEIAQERPRTLATELLSDLRQTQFMDIGEFGRPVHADMAALIDAA